MCAGVYLNRPLPPSYASLCVFLTFAQTDCLDKRDGVIKDGKESVCVVRKKGWVLANGFLRGNQQKEPNQLFPVHIPQSIPEIPQGKVLRAPRFIYGEIELLGLEQFMLESLQLNADMWGEISGSVIPFQDNRTLMECFKLCLCIVISISHSVN